MILLQGTKFERMHQLYHQNRAYKKVVKIYDCFVFSHEDSQESQKHAARKSQMSFSDYSMKKKFENLGNH